MAHAAEPLADFALTQLRHHFLLNHTGQQQLAVSATCSSWLRLPASKRKGLCGNISTWHTKIGGWCLRGQHMDASSSQIQVRVLPEEVSQPEVVREAVERQLRKERRPAIGPEKELHVLRQSWDARKRPVRVQLLVGWDEGARKAQIQAWTWPHVNPDAQEVIIVGAGPAGIRRIGMLGHGVPSCWSVGRTCVRGDVIWPAQPRTRVNPNRTTASARGTRHLQRRSVPKQKTRRHPQALEWMVVHERIYTSWWKPIRIGTNGCLPC